MTVPSDPPSWSVALAAGGAAWETAVVREVEEAALLVLARRCMDVAELLAVAGTSADVAVVDVALPGLDVDAVTTLLRRGVRVLAVGSHERAQDLGIPIVVGPGDVEAAVAASGRSRSESVSPPADGKTSEISGRTVAVWGPSGAPGRSTLALAVAAELAGRGESVVLVDADVYGGSQAQQVALLDDVSGLVAACRDANRGGTVDVGRHVVNIADGLDLLTGLPRADMWPTMRPAALDRVMAALTRRYQHVVVDCGFCLEESAGGGPGRHQATRQLLESSDTVLAVGRADPVGLARLVRALHELRSVVVQEPTVVLNQVRATLGWDSRELAATVRRLGDAEPVALLPQDVASLDHACMAGELVHLVAPDSGFVTEVGRLVDTMTGPATDVTARVAASRP